MNTSIVAHTDSIGNPHSKDTASETSVAGHARHAVATVQASRMLADALALAGVSAAGFSHASGCCDSKAKRWTDASNPESPNLRHLIQATGTRHGARVVAELVRALSELVEPIPCVRRSVPERMLDATVALGTLATTTRDALADGQIDASERIALLRAAKRLEQVAGDLIRELLG